MTEKSPKRDVSGWLDTYRQFWEQSLDRLDLYLTKLQQGDPDGDRH